MSRLHLVGDATALLERHRSSCWPIGLHRRVLWQIVAPRMPVKWTVAPDDVERAARLFDDALPRA